MHFKFRLAAIVAIAATASLTSCKKDRAANSDNTTEISQHNDDQQRVSSDMDDVANDADVAIESDVVFSGKGESALNITSICGATAVADTVSNPWKITITYNGNNCQGTTFRQGTVVLSMPQGVRWKNVGAVLTVSIQNLKIKRLSDNKSITINGTHTITNVTGGLLINLPVLQTIVHTINSSNMSITFDDNSQRTWQVARKRTYTYDNGVVLSVTGTHIDGANEHIAEWGTNRFGHAFTTSITGALVFKQSCSGRLTAGEIKHQGFATSTVKFGLDANGNPTGCPGTGHYYFRLTWTGPNGNTQSTLLPY